MKIFEQKGQIEFAKIEEFSIDLSKLQMNVTDFVIDHSFLSVIVFINTYDKCDKSTVKKY